MREREQKQVGAHACPFRGRDTCGSCPVGQLGNAVVWGGYIAAPHEMGIVFLRKKMRADLEQTPGNLCHMENISFNFQTICASTHAWGLFHRGNRGSEGQRALPQAKSTLQPDLGPLPSSPAGCLARSMVGRRTFMSASFLLEMPPVRHPPVSGYSGAKQQRRAGLPLTEVGAAGGGNVVHRKDVIEETLSAPAMPPSAVTGDLTFASRARPSAVALGAEGGSPSPRLCLPVVAPVLTWQICLLRVASSLR